MWKLCICLYPGDPPTTIPQNIRTWTIPVNSPFSETCQEPCCRLMKKTHSHSPCVKCLGELCCLLREVTCTFLSKAIQCKLCVWLLVSAYLTCNIVHAFTPHLQRQMYREICMFLHAWQYPCCLHTWLVTWSATGTKVAPPDQLFMVFT